MKIRMATKGDRFVVYRTEDDKKWRWQLHLSSYGSIAIGSHSPGYASRDTALRAVKSAVGAFKNATSEPGELRVECEDRYRFRRRR